MVPDQRIGHESARDTIGYPARRGGGTESDDENPVQSDTILLATVQGNVGTSVLNVTVRPDLDMATIRLTRASNAAVPVGWFTFRSYPRTRDDRLNRWKRGRGEGSRTRVSTHAWLGSWRRWWRTTPGRRASV